MSFGKHVEKIDEGEYRVSLSIKAVREKEYEAIVAVSGYCNIPENDPFKDQILNENAIAILFLYVRADLALITAQPEAESLTIPVVNINAMFKHAENSE